jgi:hypothetical protein
MPASLQQVLSKASQVRLTMTFVGNVSVDSGSRAVFLPTSHAHIGWINSARTSVSAMNINLTIQCDVCTGPTNCRIGLSNRDPQPLEFSCPTCGSPISITLWKTKGADIVGAKQIKGLMPFDNTTNFVDLHIDFPVSFDNYVMGNTPFMRAAGRLGHEHLMLHQGRLDFLNREIESFRVFGLLLKLYINEKWTPFKLTLERKFKINLVSESPEDIDAALYRLISRVMMPFAYPHQDLKSVELFMGVIRTLGRDHRAAAEAFMKELIDTGFLKNLQIDCLGIYPRILAAEIPLRPALFLDFDDEFKDNPIPMRVSNAVFEAHKDLYKDISEIISRQFILVAGINNLLKRGDHNLFLPEVGKAKSGRDFTPKSLHDYGDVPFGKKLDFIDDSWFELFDGGADNQLRNAIAHHKTEYDEITQTVTYFPRMEGMRQEKSEKMSFLQFMRQLLISYREMHRLHHLIKCLFFLHFIILSRPTKA